jgi:predicted PurR-regulated permease PerM
MEMSTTIEREESLQVPEGPTAESGPVRFQWRLVPPLAISLVLGLGTLAIIPLLARPLALLIVGITMAQAFAPIVAYLQEHRVRRDVAILMVYCALFAVFGLLAWALLPQLIAQTRALVEGLPGMLDQVRAALSRFGPVANGRLEQMIDAVSAQTATSLVGVPMDAFAVVLEVLLIIFLSIYWLAGQQRMLRFFLSMVPRERREGAEHVMHRMGRSMGGYVRGAVINALIMGLLAFAGLAIIGVPFPILLGLMTMLGEMVPIIGPIVVGIIVVMVALTESFTKGVIAGILFTVLTQLEGTILTPNIMKSQTRVPQALVLFAIVVGGAVGGLLGVLVAVPVAAALRVIVVEVIAPAQRRWSGITRPKESRANGN